MSWSIKLCLYKVTLGINLKLTFSRTKEYWGQRFITTSYWIRKSLIFSYISSAKGEVEWFVDTPDHGTCIMISTMLNASLGKCLNFKLRQQDVSGGGNTDRWGDRERERWYAHSQTSSYHITKQETTYGIVYPLFSRESPYFFCFAQFKQVKFHILYPHHYIIVEQVHRIYTSLHGAETKQNVSESYRHLVAANSSCIFISIVHFLKLKSPGIWVQRVYPHKQFWFDAFHQPDIPWFKIPFKISSCY